MIFLMFLILLLTAGIIFFTNPKSEQARWTALFMLCGSVGAFAYVITETIIPFMDQINITSSTLRSVLIHLRIHLNFVTEIVTPYAVIMFSIVSYGRIPHKVKKYLSYFLVIPIVIMYYITPFDPIHYQINFKFALIWITPYYLFSCFLLFVAYFNEKTWTKKLNRLITLSICVPSILSVLIFDSIAKMINPDTNLFRLVPISIVYSFIVFIIFSYFSGALGVKMKFEQHVLDNTMKAISSGTSLLNHSIKNQIYKIHTSLHIIKSFNGNSDEEAYKEALEIINRCSNHLIDMVERIKNQSEEIRLDERTCNLSQLLDESIEYLSLGPMDKGITLYKQYDANIQIICDGVHIKEVFLNILKNAVEAIETSGNISITTSLNRAKDVIVSIRDNGCGISKDNLAHIIDPFFTTKGNSNRNFGLGLSYCYNVMIKSGGNMQIDSVVNEGTTVKLIFPRKGG
ncbi:ATP-binding protein [Paenibacillus sp. SN-8-1]|uniref:sensor histidine kinase n=1 Tax=Paenibacillus sp. SN-8-1 TaxID=3435409 RepID=UPI003D9A1118